jgi:nucleotide-binding universal stress UspA family protein
VVSAVAANGSVRIVVGVDPSLAGLRALRLAVAEARRRGAVLHAVRAWNFNPVWDASLLFWYEEMEQDAADTIVRAFGEAMGGVPKDIRVVPVTVRGTPATGLVDYARRDDDLLFVGCSRRRGLRGLARRTTATQCATHARCPVVVVPPDAFTRDACREGIRRAIRRDLPVLTG